MPLDSVQAWVLSLFWDARNATHPDCGIAIPEDTDPVIADHLREMDRIWREGRMQAIEAQRPPAPAPDAPPAPSKRG